MGNESKFFLKPREKQMPRSSPINYVFQRRFTVKVYQRSNFQKSTWTAQCFVGLFSQQSVENRSWLILQCILFCYVFSNSHYLSCSFLVSLSLRMQEPKPGLTHILWAHWKTVWDYSPRYGQKLQCLTCLATLSSWLRKTSAGW